MDFRGKEESHIYRAKARTSQNLEITLWRKLLVGKHSKTILYSLDFHPLFSLRKVWEMVNHNCKCIILLFVGIAPRPT
jgi:hypothetical protein